MSDKKIAVVAFGGNAIIKEDEEGYQEEQLSNAEEACDLMANFIERGYDLLVVHGNGPQVGNILIQMEEASLKVPPSTLDVCVALTQGSMGYLLENGLVNGLRRRGIERDVVVICSQVIVDRNDPLMEEPTKPIGPFFTYYRARQLIDGHNWKMIEDSGRGWRKVVPSPRPVKVLAEDTIKRMLAAGAVVIAGGGGGIPVYEDERGNLVGVEAVIDKDYTAGILASAVGADLFVNLTGVDIVYLDYNTPNPKPLPELKVSEARRYLDNGQFPAGSMGPKIDASCEFIESGGREVLITSAELLTEALEKRTGTRIVPD